MKKARNKEHKIITYIVVFLHTSTVITVTFCNCNFILSYLDKYKLVQLKFIQNTIIKVFFLVHYFNYATLLYFSYASLIPSPSNMNYGSSFAWLFKYKTTTHMSTFICYQDVSLGHLFARASLAVHLLNLPNKPLFNWYHHFCIKHGKLYIFCFLKSYVLIKHWLEHWWTATNIYATSHNTVNINKHFLRLHFKIYMCSTN